MAARSPTGQTLSPYDEFAQVTAEMLQKLQERIAALEETNSQLLTENDVTKRKLRSTQQEVFEARHNYDRLEMQMYQKDQLLGNLEQEQQTHARVRREFADKLRKEAKQFEKERLAWAERENELTAQLKRQAYDRRRFTVSGPPKTSNSNACGLPVTDESGITDDAVDSTAPDAAPTTADLERRLLVANRTVRAQGKMVQDLRQDIIRLKDGKAHLQETYDQQGLRVLQLEAELTEMKQVNHSLMEDNESYQMLLHEKTVDGSFNIDGFGQSTRGSSHDALSDLASELRPAEPTLQAGGLGLSAPGSPLPLSQGGGAGMDLAAELDRATLASPTPPDEPHALLKAKDEKIEKLRADLKTKEKEVKACKDETKALGLYINKILGRIMASGKLQEVLAQDYASGQSKADPESTAQEQGQGKNTTLNGIPEDDEDDNDSSVDAMTQAARTAARLRAQREQRRRSVDHGHSPPAARPGRSNTVIGSRPSPIITSGAVSGHSDSASGPGSGFRSMFALLSPRSSEKHATRSVAHTRELPMTAESALASWDTPDDDQTRTAKPGSGTRSPSMGSNGSHASRTPRRANTVLFPSSTSISGTAYRVGDANSAASSVHSLGGRSSTIQFDASVGATANKADGDAGRPESTGATTSRPQSHHPHPSDPTQVTGAPTGWKAAWRRMSIASPWKG
ncbi:hypothetical protein H4R35_000939 [Dimargaris xerosporica]|nr:hypothetical protein H4R35_000939 [Dimargaris xerosporica]